MVKTAIILAGGLGTRLRSAVPDLPKPMAPINGRPFLEYQLDYWIGQGIRHFILSVGYRREDIMTYFKDRYREAAMSYAVEETPLGTGGGLLQAAQLVPAGESFLVLNGDTFFTVPLAALEKTHKTQQSSWTMALFTADTAGRYGKVDCAPDGRITRFSADKAQVGEAANGGVYLLSADTLAGLPAGVLLSLEQEILPGFITRGGRCFGEAFQGQFFDIGIPQDYYQAATLLAVN